MKKQITIAIDGWSSCGKSTLAKALAKALNYVYIDSGAMYRGVALYAMRKNWATPSQIQIEKLIENLEQIKISFLFETPDATSLLLNNENVENQIRGLQVSNVVSQVAKIKEVRTHLVRLQREMGKSGGVVMDGRDIGSVVFPNAELKIFLTADYEIRVKRRFDELIKKGENITMEEVRHNLKLRDEMDANRKESPLILTPDAVVIDNSDLTQEEQLSLALNLVEDIVES